MSAPALAAAPADTAPNYYTIDPHSYPERSCLGYALLGQVQDFCAATESHPFNYGNTQSDIITEGYYDAGFYAIQAAKGGHTNILQALHERNFPWGADHRLRIIFETAAQYGHRHIMQWFLDRAIAIPAQVWARACEGAAEVGDLALLQWLRLEQQAPWDRQTMNTAVYRGNLQIMQWAWYQGAPYELWDLYRHALMQPVSEQVMNWMVSKLMLLPSYRGAAGRQQRMACAAVGGNLQLLYAYEAKQGRFVRVMCQYMRKLRAEIQGGRYRRRQSMYVEELMQAACAPHRLQQID